MRALVILPLLAALASAGVTLGPYGYAGPYAYGAHYSHPFAYAAAVPHAQTLAYAAPLGHAYAAPYAHAYAAPVATSSQYHAQDELGQYSYGYAGGPSAKNEVRDAHGITRGGYSYIDANGIPQTVNYVADALGFRVAATNLPVATKAALQALPEPVMDTPEVQAAKAEHFAAVAEAKAAAGRKKRSLTTLAAHPLALHASPRFAYSYSAPAYTYAPHRYYSTPTAVTHAAHTTAYAAPYAHTYAAPYAHAYAAPYAHAYAAPVATSSQYHAQDELGQYSYGYAGGPSAKNEVRDAHGITRGGYSYIDANGIPQTVNYVADALGFRVAATNLPVAPKAAVVAPQALPVPVMDTPEVQAARAEHLAAVAEAQAQALA